MSLRSNTWTQTNLAALVALLEVDLAGARFGFCVLLLLEVDVGLWVLFIHTRACTCEIGV